MLLDSTLLRWGPAGIVSDEGFGVVDLVDDNEPLVPLDHAFNPAGFVSGDKYEAVVLAANGLVFVDREFNSAVAPTILGAALA